jgi:hypothetical protein
MNITATISGYMASAHEAESDVEEIQYRIASTQKELHKLNTLLIGARERVRESREVLRLAKEQDTREEISHRVRDILSMKGIPVVVGDELTQSVRELLGNGKVSEAFARLLEKV